jgi:predicted  nucleic acid-binding Zn-ribbon protein
MKDLNKLTTKEVLNDLFNIVSNGDYDMNELRHHFDRVDKDLTKQQKKDKLLELYRNEIFRLQDKIKALEEELKK